MSLIQMWKNWVFSQILQISVRRAVTALLRASIGSEFEIGSLVWPALTIRQSRKTAFTATWKFQQCMQGPNLYKWLHADQNILTLDRAEWKLQGQRIHINLHDQGHIPHRRMASRLVQTQGSRCNWSQETAFIATWKFQLCTQGTDPYKWLHEDKEILQMDYKQQKLYCQWIHINLHHLDHVPLLVWLHDWSWQQDQDAIGHKRQLLPQPESFSFACKAPIYISGYMLIQKFSCWIKSNEIFTVSGSTSIYITWILFPILVWL